MEMLFLNILTNIVLVHLLGVSLMRRFKALISVRTGSN